MGKEIKMMCKNKGRKGTGFPMHNTLKAATSLVASYKCQSMKTTEGQRYNGVENGGKESSRNSGCCNDGRQNATSKSCHMMKWT
jgi:hypothetical protein